MSKKRKLLIAVIILIIGYAAFAIVTAASYHRSISYYTQSEDAIDTIFNNLKLASSDHINEKIDSLSFIKIVNEAADAVRIIIASLETPASTKAADNVRKQLLRKAYLTLNYGLSGYHCARAVLYSPSAAGDNMCFLYNTTDIEKDIVENGTAAPPGAENPSMAASAVLQEAISFLPALTKDKRPSIILIVIDTLRADMLYNKEYAPFLNRLAKEGLYFNNALSTGSNTHTSVASILTGAPPYAHRLITYGNWENSLMFVPLLRDAGYDTAAFSANSIVEVTAGFGNGFNFFDDRFWMPAELLNNEIYSYLDTRLTSPSEPHFIFMQFIDPHDPYFSPDTFNEKTGIHAKFPESVAPNRIRKALTHKGLDARDYLEDEAVNDMKFYYTQEIKYTDHMMEQLFNRLQKSGVLENSIVFITSDHGEEFLEHGGVKHSLTLYNELIHVPLIVWGKKIPDSWRSAYSPDRPVSLIDLAPTILEFAGIKRPGHMSGTHLFLGPPAKNRFAVTAGFSPGSLTSSCTIHTVITPDWKLIRCPENKTYQIFDSHVDPENLFPLENPDQQTASALAEILSDWQKTTTSPSHAPRGPLSPETLKQLKSLGYVQ